MRSLLLAVALAAGCVPAALTTATIREERRVSSEAVEMLERVQLSLARLDSSVAAVASEATGTVRAANAVVNQVQVLLGLAIVAIGAAYGWAHKSKVSTPGGLT